VQKLNKEGIFCTTRILKYWEEKLNLPVSRDGKNRYRNYSEDDLNQIKTVLKHKIAISKKKCRRIYG